MEIDKETLPEMMIGASGPNVPLTNAEVQKKMNSAVAVLHSATGRIKELQDYCSHDDSNVELLQGSLRFVCVYCNKAVGYLSVSEQKEAGY
jgi:hypothetical protein